MDLYIACLGRHLMRARAARLVWQPEEEPDMPCDRPGFDDRGDGRYELWI